MLSAAPNRLIFNSIPLNGTDEMIAAGVVAARQTAVFLAAIRHTNNIATLSDLSTKAELSLNLLGVASNDYAGKNPGTLG